MVNVTLKDGTSKAYAKGTTILEIAKDLSEGLARNACCGKIDGEVADLRDAVEKDCTVEICTFDSPEGKKAYRHTASHIMAQAVKRLYPEASLLLDQQLMKVSTMILTESLSQMKNLLTSKKK